MKKRPLCLTALTVVFLLLLLPAGLWFPKPCAEEEERSPKVLTGEICGIDPDGKTVFLRSTNLSDTGIILVSFKAETSFSIGNTICIDHFQLKQPEKPRNPGQFDACLYYRTKGVEYFCYAEDAVLTDGRVRKVSQALHVLQRETGKRLTRLLGSREGGVLAAMLLGNREDLDPDLKGLYQRSGISHLLAISGLHISLVGTTLYRFLRKAGFSFSAAGIPSAVFTLFYGMMTGMGVSTARAVILFCLAAAADMLGKSYDMLTALSAAALLLLAKEPLYVRSPSFLLSFGAVLGIGLIYPELAALFPVRRKTVQSFCVSLSVQLMLTPLLAYFYFELPVYGILLNLLLIPLMTILMYAGMLAAFVSAFSMKAACVPAAFCSLILKFYEKAGKWSLRLPGSVFVCGKPREWKLIFYYGTLAALLIWRAGARRRQKLRICAAEEEEESVKKEPRIRQKQTVFVLVCLFIHLILFLRIPAGLEFTMMDVGQGDGLFLKTEQGTAVLVDGGSSDISGVGTYRILPFLKSQGIRRLDYVIVTHMDADHYSGVEEILEKSAEPGEMKVGCLLLSKQSSEEKKGEGLIRLAKEAGAEARIIEEGMCIRDGALELTCLYPEKGMRNGDKNEGSVVLKAVFGEVSLLLTGDLGEEGERKLLESGENLDCDILKAGHHGSRTSTTEEWLQAVSPKLTIISCGQENSYGHPHKETLERLKNAGSSVLTTAEHGAITVRSDGKSFQAEGFLP